MINWLDFCAALLPMYHWCSVLVLWYLHVLKPTYLVNDGQCLRFPQAQSINLKNKIIAQVSTPLAGYFAGFVISLEINAMILTLWIQPYINLTTLQEINIFISHQAEEPENHRLKKVPLQKQDMWDQSLEGTDKNIKCCILKFPTKHPVS